MGNDSPPHLSPNLHSNLQIKMPKRKSEKGLLNTLQKDDRLYRMYRERMAEGKSHSASPEEDKAAESVGDDSFFTLRNMMSAVRQSRIGQAFTQSKQYFAGSQEQLGPDHKSQSVENLQRPVARSSLPSNLRKTFEKRKKDADVTDAAFLPGRESREAIQ